LEFEGGVISGCFGTVEIAVPGAGNTPHSSHLSLLRRLNHKMVVADELARRQWSRHGNRSRWPRTFTPSRQKPLSSLWKVTHSGKVFAFRLRLSRRPILATCPGFFSAAGLDTGSRWT
jgi:hypothetical protein